MKSSKRMFALLGTVALLGLSLSAAAQSVTIQENTVGFCRVDGTVDSNHGGFTGGGFANADNSTGKGVDWSVSASATGIYQLEWRYANGGTDRPGSVKVNGANVATLNFPSTGVWNSWTTVNTTVSLSSGRNTIRLEATASSGLANIDSLAVTGGSAVQAADCNGGTGGTDGDYYVAPGGSDSNPGTLDRPFASLQKAIEVAQAGDLIYVRGGVYNITNPAIPRPASISGRAALRTTIESDISPIRASVRYWIFRTSASSPILTTPSGST